MQINGPKKVQIIELRQYSFQEHEEHCLGIQKKLATIQPTMVILGL
jgi:hypothetical protein